MIRTRPATQADLENSEFRPLNILNEQGVTFSERFTLKNLASNPSRAKAYLRGIGYDVRDLPQSKQRFMKWNFAVRKSPNDFWKVVDPDGFELQDFSDLVADGLVGIASGAGLTFGAIGAAAGAAGAEAGRQAIGSAVGIPDNISGLQIGAAGVGGAISPVVNRAVGALARGAGTLGTGLAARLVGAKPLRGLNISASEVFQMRALSNVPISKALPSLTDASKRVANSFRIIRDNMPIEGVMARELEEEATTAGIRMSVKTTLSRLDPSTVTASENALSLGSLLGRGRQAGDLDKVRSLVSGVVRNEFGLDDNGRITASAAARVKELLQDIARTKGAYENTGISLSEPLKDRLTAAAAEMRTEILGKMGPFTRRVLPDGTEISEYASHMKFLETRLNDLKRFESNFNLSGGKKDTPERLVERIGQRIKTMIGSDTKEDVWDFLIDWEKRFGIEGALTNDIRITAVGTAIGDQGRTSFIPTFTATGNILGASLITGTGLPATIAAGAALSPRSLLLATRLASRATRAAGQIAASPLGRGLSVTQQQAALLAVRSVSANVEPTGKGVAREGGKRKTRTVLIGR